MKKLDNHGWGISVFIIFLVVFFLALLVIAFLAYRVDNDSHIPLIHKEFINIYQN